VFARVALHEVRAGAGAVHGGAPVGLEDVVARPAIDVHFERDSVLRCRQCVEGLSAVSSATVSPRGM